MENLKECNLAWREHIVKNRFLLLYMDDYVKEIMEQAVFVEIHIAKSNWDLRINFKNEGVGQIFTVFGSPIKKSWVMLESKTSLEKTFSFEKGTAACNLLSSFEWYRYINLN